MVLNTGTKRSEPTPKKKIKLLCFVEIVTSLLDSEIISGRFTSPFSMKVMIESGTNIEINEGMNVSKIIFIAVIFPLIHNIMVVTSPIGLHAPPEFAARITIPQKNQRSCLFSISFRSKAHITMAVVRLSNTADIKKVRILIIHKSFLLLVVLIFSVIILNP